MIGPVNLNTSDIITIQNDKDTLPDFEIETIAKALEHRERYNRSAISDMNMTYLLNLFIGSKYSPEEMKSMLLDPNGYDIDQTNEKYLSLYNESITGFPIMWMKIKEHKIPILAQYGGEDELIGIKHPYILQKTCKENNIPIHMVYSRYNWHGFIELKHEEGRKAAKEFNYYMLKFSEKYFDKY